MNESIECAVLFADIVDSTGLYNRLGQTRAHDVVAQGLARLLHVARDRNGVVIKTIGDEVMCKFAHADDAVRAACRMHEALEYGARIDSIALAAHIGVHYGPAFAERGDVHGDAPNLAASMTSIAKPGQIITTESVVKRLSPELAAQARLYDLVSLKGGQPELAIFEVLWDQENATRIMTRADLAAQRGARLQFRYRSHELVAMPDSPVLLIGRGADCHLIVNASRVSRVHASIEYQRGKFVLIDQSTNGTFVNPDNGQEIYLRREQMPLLGTGRIGLGQALSPESAADIVHYVASWSNSGEMSLA